MPINITYKNRGTRNRTKDLERNTEFARVLSYETNTNFSSKIKIFQSKINEVIISQNIRRKKLPKQGFVVMKQLFSREKANL